MPRLKASDFEDPFLRIKRRRLLTIAGLISFFLLSVFICIFVGTMGPIGPGIPEPISFRMVLDILLGREHLWPEYSEIVSTIIWEIRIPRILLAALVGCGLAVAGTAMQALFRNPMADPFIIGVSSGAAVGAALAGLIGFEAVLGITAQPILAFITALVTVFVVYRLGTIRGRIYVETLLLSGVAMAAFLGALVSLMIYFAGQQFHKLIFWLLGSLTLVSWTEVLIMAPAMIGGAFVIFLFSRDLNALLLGEETAHNLGADPERLKKIILYMTALMTALAVAFTGIIGFVGLIIPHIMRLIVGTDHRMLVPAAALGGASFLIWADAISRTIIAPTSLPVGIITALCGGPFFLFLLRQRKLKGEAR